MNRKIGTVGSAVSGISVLCFALFMLIRFDFGSYFVCMFLAMGYIMMSAAFQAECGAKNETAGNLGLVFAGIYAALILIVYFAQTTTVRLDTLNETASRLINFKKSGLFFNYDLLGYAMMALSTFFTGLTIPIATRQSRALRRLMLIHGVFFISCFIAPMLGLFSADSGTEDIIGTALLEVWCAYFLPITVLSYLHFSRKKQS